MTAGKTQQMSFSGGCFCQIEIAAVEGKEPVIEERFDPDRTILTLEFVEKEIDNKNKRRKQAKKTSEESKRRKQAKKTSEEKTDMKVSTHILIGVEKCV